MYSKWLKSWPCLQFCSVQQGCCFLYTFASNGWCSFVSIEWSIFWLRGKNLSSLVARACGFRCAHWWNIRFTVVLLIAWLSGRVGALHLHSEATGLSPLLIVLVSVETGTVVSQCSPGHAIFHLLCILSVCSCQGFDTVFRTHFINISRREGPCAHIGHRQPYGVWGPAISGV